ncbi:unnamed protein product [Cylindrotheca closterium]|uniref:Uncharacterized protein n=1 Tax=Cylindrotheca closterium TaxID=2856 RepID=A0AAD2CZ32_9STRA|nr:unnamed protein product [Cylindrotheca closterium]
MMQVPSGMQLMQIPTQGGGTVTVPYSMNANGEIAFSRMQLGHQGFSGSQVRQGFHATQAQTPQVVKTGYFNTTTLEDPIKLLKHIEQCMKKSADVEYDFLDFWEANQKFFAMKQGTNENLMHFKEQSLRQAEVLQDQYGVAWFRNFAVKTTAYAAIASTDTAAQDKFKDDIFEAVLATGFLCNCNQMRTAPLMLDLQPNYCREVDYHPKTEKTNQRKAKGKGKDGKKKAACYVCVNEDHMSPKCPDRLLPKIQWKDPDQYVDYGTKLNLNQIGATVPATVPGASPVTSIVTSGASSVARSVNTPLRLAGTTGGQQMMQVPPGMQLMQIPTQGGGTVTVPL